MRPTHTAASKLLDPTGMTSFLTASFLILSILASGEAQATLRAKKAVRICTEVVQERRSNFEISSVEATYREWSEVAVANVNRMLTPHMVVPKKIQVEACESWSPSCGFLLDDYDASVGKIRFEYLGEERKLSLKARRSSVTTEEIEFAGFLHEYGHGVFAANVSAGEFFWPEDLEAGLGTLEAYDELFADLLAVLATNRLSAISDHLKLIAEDSQEKRDAHQRDFAAHFAPAGWSETDPHVFLTPTRSFLGKLIRNRVDLMEDRGKFAKLVFDVMLKFRLSAGRERLSPSAANIGLIKAIEHAIEKLDLRAARSQRSRG